MKINNSTIITVNDTSQSFDFSNIESLVEMRDLQAMKLRTIREKQAEADKDNWSLNEKLRKMRIQQGIDRKQQNKLAESLDIIDKIVYSCENVKYLESGRKISVEGLS